MISMLVNCYISFYPLHLLIYLVTRYSLIIIHMIFMIFISLGDGRVNPVDVTMSLAKGARMLGVRTLTGIAVAGITSKISGNRMDRTVTGLFVRR